MHCIVVQPLLLLSFLFLLLLPSQCNSKLLENAYTNTNTDTNTNNRFLKGPPKAKDELTPQAPPTKDEEHDNMKTDVPKMPEKNDDTTATRQSINNNVTYKEDEEESSSNLLEENKTVNEQEQQQKQQTNVALVGGEATAATDTDNLCTQASTCNECLLQDTIVSAQQYSCDWKLLVGTSNMYECRTLPKVDFTESGTQQQFSCNDDGLGNGGIDPMIVAVLVFAVLVIGIGMRMRSKKNKEGLGGSSGRNSNNETVPLNIANNEEEWGWEDDVTTTTTNMTPIDDKPYRDIEMVQPSQQPVVSSHTNNDDEDLQKAIAFSLEATNLQSTPNAWEEQPVIRRESSSSSTNNNTSSTTTTTTNTTTTAKNTKPKKKATSTNTDDIFASVGIASKPKFSSSAVPTTSKKQTSSLSVLATNFDGDDDEESNWGDDDDLDDLLA